MSGAFTSAQTPPPASARPRAARRRPAVATVICLMAGIAASHWAPVGPGDYLLVTMASLLGGVLFIRQGGISCLCLAGALIAVGLALGQTDFFYYPADEIGQFTSRTPLLAALELRVMESPQTHRSRRYATNDGQQLRCQVVSVRTWDGWRPATGEIAVWVGRSDIDLNIGARFRAVGWLSRMTPAMNPGQFDWSAYSRRNRALASFSIRGSAQIEIVGQDPPTPIPWLQREARQYLDMGFPEGPDHDLQRALLLGDHPPDLGAIREDFRRTGTSHHLATSGMHVAVVAMLVYAICRLLCWPPRRSTLIALGIMLIYGVMVSPSPPIVRSILLAGAIGGGVLMGRRTDALQLLGLAMLVMLIHRPLDMMGAGFQLSFAAVAALMLFTRPLGELFHGGTTKTMDVPTPTRGWRRTVSEGFRHHLGSIVATGLAAWLVCVPLIAWHFRQFNPFGLLAGAVLEPVVFLSIIAGALKIVLTFIAPFGAGLWATLTALPTSWLRHGVSLLADIPGTDLITRTPPSWLMMTWYAMLLLLIRPWRYGRRLIRAIGVTACLGGCFFLLHTRPNLPEGAVRLTLLSIGAGQCAVLELPNGRAVLFDAGSQGFENLVPQCLDPYFRLRGIRAIEAIFISHPNRDHFSAVAEAVRRYGAGRIYVTQQFVKESRPNESASQLLRDLSRMGHSPVELAAGHHIPLGNDTSVEVLWPDESTRLRDNDASLVLMLQHGPRRILLTGDIQSAAQRRVMNPHDRLHSDVLIAPHHGSSESTTGQFVQQVNPSVILSSDDGTLTQKQRNLSQRIGNRPLYRTGRDGAVTVTLNSDGRMSIEPFLNGATRGMELPAVTIDRQIHAEDP